MGNDEIGLIKKILQKTASIRNPGERVALISRFFLGIPYLDHPLAGGPDRPEVFSPGFRDGVDCFTLLDHVEALRLSSTYEEYVEHLKKIRYREGKISYQTRNHFFTDWIDADSGFVEEVTGGVGKKSVEEVEKTLNLLPDGLCYLPGILPVTRVVRYIPTEYIDEAAISRLATGDYLGIYSEKPGLDVSHVGIAVRESGKTGVLILHASSSADARKVVDQDLGKYLEGKPGLIVLRPVAGHGHAPGAEEINPLVG